MDSSKGIDHHPSPRLAELEEALRRSGAPIVDYLDEGVPHSEVTAQLEALSLAAPPSVVEWYGWHNGVTRDAVGRPNDSWSVAPAAFFLSLPEAIAQYREVSTYFAQLREDGLHQSPAIWRPSLFPLLRTLGGHLVSVECLRGTDSVWFVTFDDDALFVCSHLSEYVERLIDLWTSGRYWVGDGGRVQGDTALENPWD